MIKTYKNGSLNTDVSASSKSKQGYNRETVNDIIYKIKLDLCIVVKTYLAKFKGSQVPVQNQNICNFSINYGA